MAKVAALVFLVIAVAAASSVSARREFSSCQMEMEQKMPMNHCVGWIKGKMRSAVANPRMREGELEACCGEFMEVSSPCRCQAVREMIVDMQQSRDMGEMAWMACSIPDMCGMTQECHTCSRRVSA